jgi:hypothetical protein
MSRSLKRTSLCGIRRSSGFGGPSFLRFFFACFSCISSPPDCHSDRTEVYIGFRNHDNWRFPRVLLSGCWRKESGYCGWRRAGLRSNSPNAHPSSGVTLRIWSAAIGTLRSGRWSSWRMHSAVRYVVCLATDADDLVRPATPSGRKETPRTLKRGGSAATFRAFLFPPYPEPPRSRRLREGASHGSAFPP